jgi:hypothetical protein
VTAPFAAEAEELFEFDEDDNFDVPVDLAAEPLALALPLVGVVLDGGAEFARGTTLFHVAAAFALVSLVLTNKYDTSPLLSS